MERRLLQQASIRRATVKMNTAASSPKWPQTNAGDSVQVHYDALQREVLREERSFDGR
ncbi:MAG: hypothetical protein IJM35_02195 [Bacteroidales bacterium]|nr:hypothetical protein [Bacteroidales bacterium]